MTAKSIPMAFGGRQMADMAGMNQVKHAMA
jgi:hypothetical protein